MAGLHVTKTEDNPSSFESDVSCENDQPPPLPFKDTHGKDKKVKVMTGLAVKAKFHECLRVFSRKRPKIKKVKRRKGGIPSILIDDSALLETERASEAVPDQVIKVFDREEKVAKILELIQQRERAIQVNEQLKKIILFHFEKTGKVEKIDKGDKPEVLEGKYRLALLEYRELKKYIDSEAALMNKKLEESLAKKEKCRKEAMNQLSVLRSLERGLAWRLPKNIGKILRTKAPEELICQQFKLLDQLAEDRMTYIRMETKYEEAVTQFNLLANPGKEQVDLVKYCTLQEKIKSHNALISEKKDKIKRMEETSKLCKLKLQRKRKEISSYDFKIKNALDEEAIVKQKILKVSQVISKNSVAQENAMKKLIKMQKNLRIPPSMLSHYDESRAKLDNLKHTAESLRTKYNQQQSELLQLKEKLQLSRRTESKTSTESVPSKTPEKSESIVRKASRVVQRRVLYPATKTDLRQTKRSWAFEQLTRVVTEVKARHDKEKEMKKQAEAHKSQLELSLDEASSASSSASDDPKPQNIERIFVRPALTRQFSESGPPPFV